METPERPGASGFYAHVRAGACDIAVPTGDIVRAVVPGASDLVPMPRREGALMGTIAFEGSTVPVVDLARWVALGDSARPAGMRVLILRSGNALIGMRVDELLGTWRVRAESIRTVCHDAGNEELFEAIVPATGERPLLCLLEVQRFMTLALTWCEAAEAQPGRSAAAVRHRYAATSRHALFTIGTQLWAVPATAISRLEPAPRVELRLAGQRTCGIGSWGARKLPLVDLAFAETAADTAADTAAPGAGECARRWMAVLVRETHAIGLLVTRGDRMLDLAADDIVAVPGDELLAGTAMVAGLGRVPVLDVDRLFAAVPEATISHTPAPATASPSAALSAATAGAAVDHNSHYLVFEADRAYASPVAGVVGVTALPPPAIADLTNGRRATIEWRGQTIGVVNLPAIDGGSATAEPRIAVVVEGAQAGEGRSAIAVRSLTRWLPAGSARRSSMRMHDIGDVDVITPPGTSRNASLVVVDLKQTAYLLA